jgi:hypothetical protein
LRYHGGESAYRAIGGDDALLERIADSEGRIDDDGLRGIEACPRGFRRNADGRDSPFVGAKRFGGTTRKCRVVAGGAQRDEEGGLGLIDGLRRRLRGRKDACAGREQKRNSARNELNAHHLTSLKTLCSSQVIMV